MIALTLALLRLTVWEVVTDIPHDFSAIVIYAILGLFVAAIWYGSRGQVTAPGLPSDEVTRDA